MGQLEESRNGRITEEMREIARRDSVSPEFVRGQVAAGRICVITKTKGPRAVLGIGEGLTTKINANIGTSSDVNDPDEELAKLMAAEQAGADAVMDLSTAGDLPECLGYVVQNSHIVVGSVPVYSAVKKSVTGMSEDDMLNAVKWHVDKGASYLTIHAAILREGFRLAQSRVLKVVSRGGSFIASWSAHNGKENPYYTNFDYVCEMLKENDVNISLGDGLRPGGLVDALDRAQIHEMNVQGELVKRARELGVQVFCEGPGHVPLHKIEENVRMHKAATHYAPLYVLGPLTTDLAAGYDHISNAIGAAVASASGADFLCIVTPAEHVALPDPHDIHEGVMATRIAGHSGDIAKLGLSARDEEMSRARYKLDWNRQFELALDGKRAAEYFHRRHSRGKACSMCGAFCAYAIAESGARKLEAEAARASAI